MKIEEKTMTVEEAISMGYSTISELGEEMRDWADNLEEKFSATAKYEQVSEAADALQEHEEFPDEVPEALNALKVTFHIYTKRKESRSMRRSNATAALQAVRDVLEELEDEDLKDQAEGIITALECTIDDIDAVEFPGAFG